MDKQGQKRTITSFLLIAVMAAGLGTGFYFSRELGQQAYLRLHVLFKEKESSRERTTSIRGIESRQMRRLIKRVQERGFFPEQIRISGVLLVDESGLYSFALAANRSARFFINGEQAGKASVFNRHEERIVQIELEKGAKPFILEYFPAMRNPYLGVLWKRPQENDFHSIAPYRLFSPAEPEGKTDRLYRLQSKTKRLVFFKNTGFISGAAALLFFMALLFFWGRGKGASVSPPQNVHFPAAAGRLTEIDKTKGFAGYLMILAHISSLGLLPFGTFGAALFFLCSGMNTILFLDRTRKKRYYNYYHLFFGILLFIGGYTQIVIAHPGNARFVPEFLQVSALSILMIFGLSKCFRNMYHAGFLFPVPFLLHFLFLEGIIRLPGKAGAVTSFFFGTGAFPLFPWAGFFLYGVFLLHLHKKKGALPVLTGLTGMLSVILIFVLNIPIEKWGMSLSYVSLSLFAGTLLFAVFYLMTVKNFGRYFKTMNAVLEIVGRNSLMFVYVHYLAVDIIKPKGLMGYPFLDLLVSALFAFLFSAFIVFYYERSKNDDALFLPVWLAFILLLAVRYGHFLSPASDVRWIDIFIGVLFAFLYVKLRRKLRPRPAAYVPF
jgi:hypothetical protein